MLDKNDCKDYLMVGNDITENLSQHDEKWQINPNGRNDSYLIDFVYKSNNPLSCWMKASVKYDGSVSILNAYNYPFELISEELDEKRWKDTESINIDDIDTMIKELQELREISSKSFKLHGINFPRY